MKQPGKAARRWFWKLLPSQKPWTAGRAGRRATNEGNQKALRHQEFQPSLGVRHQDQGDLEWDQ